MASAPASQFYPDLERLSTGVPGLDDILGGGLPRNRLYLVQGDPGVGKTTLALQFLLEGSAKGERVLYITLSESRDEISDVVRSHGWSLDGIDVYECSPDEQLLNHEPTTVFHPAEIELGETIHHLMEAVERVQPTRVVIDSLSELRLLATDALRYRREILYLKQFFSGRKSTILLLDDRTTDVGDRQLQSLCHGVLILEDSIPDYGSNRRHLRVAKLRGVRFRGGNHDYVIRTGGLDVYPRLVAAEHRNELPSGRVPSGVRELDDLLDGGLDTGTSVVMIGPSGAGKSTVAARFGLTAVQNGNKAVFFLFEEVPAIFFQRLNGLNMDAAPYLRNGSMIVKSVDPAELAPNEFAQQVRDAVERDGARMIVIDSLNSYLNAMPGERYLILQLHELLSYLSQQGVTTIVIAAQHGMLASGAPTSIDVSYLADTVLLFRYFEHAGVVKMALSVFKRRSGNHERTIRELQIGGPNGIQISPPLAQFRGILSGVPILETAGMAPSAQMEGDLVHQE